MAPSPGVSGHHLPAEIVGRFLRTELGLPTDVTTGWAAQDGSAVNELSMSSRGYHRGAPGVLIRAGRRGRINIGFMAPRCRVTDGARQGIRSWAVPN
jgi:hypothetical protein